MNRKGAKMRWPSPDEIFVGIIIFIVIFIVFLVVVAILSQVFGG